MLTKPTFRTVAIVVGLGLASVGYLAAKDPIVMDMEDMLEKHPANVRMILENDHVWVFEVRLRPGESLGTHRTGDFFVYALTDADLTFIPSYEPELIQLRSGEAFWHHFEPHAVVNRGTKDAKYLVVARRGSVLPKQPAERGHPLAHVAPPSMARTMLDNRNGRVSEVTLQPGEEQPVHYGLNRVIYSLSAYTIEMGGREVAFEPGTAHFHKPDNHGAKNVGETTARYLVFELKM